MRAMKISEEELFKRVRDAALDCMLRSLSQHGEATRLAEILSYAMAEAIMEFKRSEYSDSDLEEDLDL